MIIDVVDGYLNPGNKITFGLGHRRWGTLRSRITFATTGERLVGIVSTRGGEVLQGDDLDGKAGEDLTFDYRLENMPVERPSRVLCLWSLLCRLCILVGKPGS